MSDDLVERLRRLVAALGEGETMYYDEEIPWLREAIDRIARLEAALRPFAEAGEAHKVSSTIVAPEQWRAAAAALADAPDAGP